jgi:hypothetical protein
MTDDRFEPDESFEDLAQNDLLEAEAGLPVNTPKPCKGDPDYIGYGCPPKKHQFQKGTSGWSGGRPKGRHRFETRMARLLDQPVRTRDGQEVEQAEVLFSTVMNGMIKSDPRYIPIYLELRDRFCKQEPAEEHLDESRAQLLRQALERLNLDQGQSTGPFGPEPDAIGSDGPNEAED